MSKRKIDITELLNHLKEQNLILQNAINSFRQGKHYEAKTIATKIRVLIKNNDRSASKGLIQQLCSYCKENFSLLSSSYSYPNGANFAMLYQADLTQNKQQPLNIEIESKKRNKEYRIDDWLNQIIFIFHDDNGKHEITKGALLFTMADQDGGAHVDGSINSEYDLARKLGTVNSGRIQYDHLREAVYDCGISVLISCVAFYEKIGQFYILEKTY